MVDVTVQKRGEVYQYKFEIVSIDGKENLKISQDSQQKAKQNKQVSLHTMSILIPGIVLNLKQCLILIILIIG